MLASSDNPTPSIRQGITEWFRLAQKSRIMQGTKPLVQGGFSFAKDSAKAAVIDGHSVGGCLKATCRSA
jgi:hypothetical protein